MLIGLEADLTDFLAAVAAVPVSLSSNKSSPDCGCGDSARALLARAALALGRAGASRASGDKRAARFAGAGGRGMVVTAVLAKI